jgi:hypothetical protein
VPGYASLRSPFRRERGLICYSLSLPVQVHGSAKVYSLGCLIPNVHMYGRGIGARVSNWINADVTLRPSLLVITMDGTLDKKREALGAGPLLEARRLTCAWSPDHMCSPSLSFSPSLPLASHPFSNCYFLLQKKSRASMGGRATASAAAPPLVGWSIRLGH